MNLLAAPVLTESLVISRMPILRAPKKCYPQLSFKYYVNLKQLFELWIEVAWFIFIVFM